ncbi:MAG: Rossmann-like and DUF2520 domain-containing protein [Candidatus Acidiferrales bacterium]
MGKTIAVVGAGRVGQTLARALRRRGYRIGAVVTLSPRTARQAARFIGAGSAAANQRSGIAAADIILIATPDSQVSRAARALSDLAATWRGKVVLHTSGPLSSRELAALARKGAAVGSLHPIYPFPRPLKDFPRGVFFGLEGEPRAVKEAATLARALGGQRIRVRADQKRLYHAAAALVAGHLMTLAELGTRMLARAGVPNVRARRALLPLAEKTLAAYTRWGERAWTGPLARGDAKTVRWHLEALQRLPRQYGEVYRVLGRAGLNLFRPASDKRTRALQALLKR